MAIKFYCDEHVDLAIANALRKRGVDVLTAQEAGMLSVPDADHLKLAISQQRTYSPKTLIFYACTNRVFRIWESYTPTKASPLAR